MTGEQVRLSTSTKLIGLFSLLICVGVWAANRIPNLYTDQIHVTGSTINTVPYFDGAQKLVSSTVTPTQLGFLQTMTTTGDSLYSSDNSGTFARLGIGANGKIYTAASGLPSWQWESGYRSVTTTDAAALTDKILFLSGTSFTETLPTAASNTGKVFTLVHAGTSLTQVYTLATTSGQTIGGVGSGGYVLQTASESLTIVSDGSNWQIVQHIARTPWTTYSPTLSAGFGTTSGVVFNWRRDGDTLYVEGFLTTGTVAGSLTTITLPNGIAVNPLALRANTTSGKGPRVGTWQCDNNQQIGSIILALTTSTTLVYLGAQVNQTSIELTPNNGNSAQLTGSSAVSLDFAVPISGWQP